MIRNELIDLLICPETQSPLKIADSATLEKLNEAIRSGAVTNRGGQSVTGLLQSGLVREDGAWFYPIVDDIPVMLMDEAISLEGLKAIKE